MNSTIEKIKEHISRAKAKHSYLSLEIRDRYRWNISAKKLKAAIEGKAELDDRVWAAIKDILASLPDAPKTSSGHVQKRYRERNPNYVTITDQMRETLNTAIAETGANITLICKQKPPEIDGLSPAVISGWRSGRTETAHKDAWAYVMKKLNRDGHIEQYIRSS